MRHDVRGPLAGLLLVLCLSIGSPGYANDHGFIREFIEGQAELLQESDFNILRRETNTPFPPLAYVGASYYGEAEVKTERRDPDVTYDLTSVSQGALFPFIVGKRDAFMVGEYVSFSEFRLKNSRERKFDVTSVGVPLAWIRQVNPGWQFFTFAVPLGHQNSADDAGWTWQTLGGAMTRWEQRDDLWWVFGVFADLGPQESYGLPYVGASWIINKEWTMSAILPWPSLIYAPSDKWLLRFGASPSAASWSYNPQNGDTAVNMNAFDFGFAAERRLGRVFWLSGEVGIGGLRGMSFSDDSFEEPDISVNSSWYATIDFKIRPSAN